MALPSTPLFIYFLFRSYYMKVNLEHWKAANVDLKAFFFFFLVCFFVSVMLLLQIFSRKIDSWLAILVITLRTMTSSSFSIQAPLWHTWRLPELLIPFLFLFLFCALHCKHMQPAHCTITMQMFFFFLQWWNTQAGPNWRLTRMVEVDCLFCFGPTKQRNNWLTQYKWAALSKETNKQKILTSVWSLKNLFARGHCN